MRKWKIAAREAREEERRQSLYTLSVYANSEKAARMGRLQAMTVIPVMLRPGQARAVAYLLLKARASLLASARASVEEASNFRVN